MFRRLISTVPVPVAREVAIFVRTPFKYSLECTSNIRDVESWAIYKDFMSVCRTGSIRDIRDFHDTHLVDYESRLRWISPDLAFTDLEHYNPFDPKGSRVRLDYDIYLMIMGTAYIALRPPSCLLPSKIDPVIEWFQQISVKNHQLK